MEHYITEIKIEELRHLSNVNIVLNKEKRTSLLGSLTVEQRKNRCGPHISCLFLSNFLFLYIVFSGNL